jgi:DNA helicase-2/ATP-dependent DNA helicase PcrA
MELAVDLLSDLNEPQRQAVMHMEGPLLVLAGAGSGKTRVITRRVAHLISQGVAPWQVLAITFTNKAAHEMVDRIANLGARGVMACTFHSLCARLLREFAEEAGVSPNYSIYDQADQRRVARLALEQAKLPSGSLTAAQVLHTISRAKMQLQTAADFEQNAATSPMRQMAKIYSEYEKLLGAANALDFDDLLLRVAQLMGRRPDIRRLLGERYRFVLIDEYQDTNHAQYVIAHGIALEHENICATGDPDQSIYSWRGARIDNILEFEHDYTNATVVRLEENYRSTPQILAAADRLISYNRLAKGLFTQRPSGADVWVVCTHDEHAEAAEVVRRARELVARGMRHDDIAVFYRLNSLSRVMEDAFRRTGVPYRIARGVAFYNRKEIKDVLAYLKLMVNPRDDLACERIINVPSRGIGSTTLARLRDFAAGRGIGLLEAASQGRMIGELGKAAANKVAAFAQLVKQLAEGPLAPVRTVLESVLAATGMEQELRAIGGEEHEELANVAELVTAAGEFDRENPSATLPDFLHLVSLVSDVDRFEGSTGAVTLMTLHAAKGLEFPAVFIVGCEEGILPFRRMGEEETCDREEERRLCFVGMTRAMDHLTLTRARYRGLRGSRQRQAASPFLAELDGPQVRHVELRPPVEVQPIRQESGVDSELGELVEETPPTFDEGFYDVKAPAASVAPAGRDSDSADVAQSDGSVPHLPPGRRVRHPMFGTGQIVSTGRSGAYTKAVIDFDQYGRKTIILQFTRLELLA